MATATDVGLEQDSVLIGEDDFWGAEECGETDEDSSRCLSQRDSVVTTACIGELLGFFSSQNYRTSSSDRRVAEQNDIVMKRCLHLISKDYEFEVIKNDGGALCNQYPSDIIIIKHEKMLPDTMMIRDPPGTEDKDVLREMILSSRTARCRSRFVVPVILLCDHTHICRSATLSTYAELCGRQGYDWLSSMWTYPHPGQGHSSDTNGLGAPPNPNPNPMTASGGQSGSDSENDVLTRTRMEDVRLLKALRVGLISDLMLENKKQKYFLTVSSSEKVDRSKCYADFGIASMPYPGCEFFRQYKENGYRAEGLKFDWSQPEVDTNLSLPHSLPCPADVSLAQRQNWDLVQITQVYLELLVNYLSSGLGSILVHCISGWDRTPLFISLLRLTLWADGLIHKSLSPFEITYFTIAYDWFLFGHQLLERLSRGEEILFFCFDFLQYITDDKYKCRRESSTAFPIPQGAERQNCASSSSSTEDLTEELAAIATSRNQPIASSAKGDTTSPVAIKGAGPLCSETDSVGSWQVLSFTDAVLAPIHRDQVGNGSLSHKGAPGGKHGPLKVEQPPPHDTSTGGEGGVTSSDRRRRLLAVRSIFTRLYPPSIQRQPSEPSGGALSSLFNKLTSSLKMST